MHRTAVIVDLIHNEFHVAITHLTRKKLVLIERAKARIHLIMVGNRIAVIRLLIHVIDKHRAWPNSGKT